jgi:hypothetical protein
VSGVVFSVANAWLQELAGPDGQQSAATRGAVSTSLGFAVAPAMSGVLAQYGPAPTTLPYLVHVAVLVVGLGALLTVPETVHVRRPGRLMTLGLPPEARRPFWAVLAPTAVGVFAFPTVAATLLPLLVVPAGVGVAYAGLIAGLALAASAVTARIGRRAQRGAAPLGMALGALGLGLGVAAIVLRSELLLLPASALLGGGRRALPHRRAHPHRPAGATARPRGDEQRVLRVRLRRLRHPAAARLARVDHRHRPGGVRVRRRAGRTGRLALAGTAPRRAELTDGAIPRPDRGPLRGGSYRDRDHHPASRTAGSGTPAAPWRHR